VEVVEPDPITVVVADDHPAIIEIVSLTLTAAGIEIVDTARDGAEALQKIDLHRPRVAVLDHRMPQMTGIEVARQTATLSPETAVVIFTGYSDQTVLAEALDAGVLGFLDKESPLEDLTRAVEAASQGGAFVDPLIGGTLATTPASDMKELTQREREVLRLLSEGLTNDEIGKRLYLSGETVRTHVRKAMNKLDASNRVEAVANAMRLGLIA
jgi:two-component system nitrate/nitrite response regulator NarL